MTKKILLFTLLLLVFSISNSIGYTSSFNIWDEISEAETFEQNGELEKAVEKWHLITEYFEEQSESNSNHQNLAIFYKKIAHYYDNEKMYSEAVNYYEKENIHWLAAEKNWGAEDMIRADEIRTTIEYFVKEKTSKQSLEKYEPTSGIYAGIYAENDKKIGQDFSKTKEVYGPHALYLLYQDWGKRFAYSIKKNSPIEDKLYKKAKTENAGIQIAMNAPKGLESISENEWILEWAKEANALDMPIFLRFLGEMNGDWVSYNGNPTLYIEKFRLVHDIMEKHAPNVAMVWCPNDVPVEADEIRIEDYYPGDKYVDWVGVNFYIDYYNSGDTTKPSNHLQNPLNHLDYIYDLYSEKKPIMISETGISHYSIPNNEDLTDWATTNLKKLYLQLPIKYPRVKAINYFSLNQANDNYKVGNRWNNYALSENNEIESTYINIIESDDFLGSINDEIDYTYKKLNAPSELSDASEVFFFLKIPDYKINRVDFYEKDKLLVSDKELPFSLETDFGQLDKLTMKIYNSANELALEKTLTINSTDPIINETEVIDHEVEIVDNEINNQTSSLIKVALPNYDISINKQLINNDEAKYPFVTYKNITYFPMTYNYSQALGLSTLWSEKNGLVINQDPALEGNVKYAKVSNQKQSVSKNAVISDYPITVNDKVINNKSEEYPLFILNDVTYFPLTWRFAVDEFNWSNKFDSKNGLQITR